MSKYKQIEIEPQRTICMCEGSAEKAIVNILLDNDLLKFSREDLIEEEVIPRLSVSDFQRRYLRTDYGDKIILIRIIDSRREAFNLKPVYANQVKVITVITAPEIEILIILAKDKYDAFKKSKKKPSDYCKEDLKMKDVKSYKFVEKYFSNPAELVSIIKKYNSIHKQKEVSLYDLLKD